MNGMKGIAVFVFAGWFAGQGLAQDAPGVENDSMVAPVGPTRGGNEWELGPEVYLYDYDEPGLMKFDGALVGFGVRFTHFAQPAKPPPPDETAGEAPVRKARPILWAFRAEGRYAAGSTDYDGRLQDGTPASVGNVDATSYEGRALFGLSFPKPEAAIALYLGIGYRFKDDDSSFDPAGYKRESKYSYIPAVLEYVRPLAHDRKLAFAVEYDLFLSGDQMSDLSPFGIGKIANNQSSGWGARAAVAYSGVWCRYGWTIEPFIRHWNIAQSDSVYRTDGIHVIEFFEPKNKTTEIGVSARARF